MTIEKMLKKDLEDLGLTQVDIGAIINVSKSEVPEYKVYDNGGYWLFDVTQEYYSILKWRSGRNIVDTMISNGKISRDRQSITYTYTSGGNIDPNLSINFSDEFF